MNLTKLLKPELALILISFFLLVGPVSAQMEEYEAAKKEIKETFGTVPAFLAAFPDHALAGAWDAFKALGSEESAIPPKYRELIQLSVAAQIPCDYCVYYHTESARNYGATEEELAEAIAHGAATRHWSMILQGNQVDLQAFKNEFQEIMDYMAEKKENK